ncbi:hypothetical protein DB30_04430 [Enhygromyxa salina]|uniref:Virginiamycin B lyase n=1 Tax=Enhygromyxa salina TaxID=215803 RepID=A0A0C2D959_9BACT|nr:hypothetical protein [Enhygromyxa salina]KIG16517.1 hypothetical protein DB30_04430 [Enhygromyxa salina]
MRHAVCSPLVATCLAAGLVLACKASEPKPAPAGETPRTATPAPAPVAASQDRAYINVEGVGVFVIDAEGWRLHYPSSDRIHQMADIEGKLHLLSSSGVHRLEEDGAPTTVVRLDEDAGFTPWRMAGNHTNDLWVLDLGDQIGHWTGTWEVTPVPAAWGEGPMGTDIAVDEHGAPWIVWNQIQRMVDGEWTTMDVPVNHMPSPPELVARAAQRTMMLLAKCDAESCELVRYSGDQQTHYSLPLEECSELAWLSVSPNAKLAAVGSWCGLVRLTLDAPHGAPQRLMRKTSNWTGVAPRSVAIDDSGRIWVGTAEGLTIIDADNRITELPIARLHDMSGPSVDILVQGEGPPLPKLGHERRGGISGSFFVEGPVHDIEVEICSAFPGPNYEPGSPRSLCDGVEPSWSATTDEAGRFEISDLPLAAYTIAAQIGDRWTEAVPAATNMRADTVTDLGELIVHRTSASR